MCVVTSAIARFIPIFKLAYFWNAKTYRGEILIWRHIDGVFSEKPQNTHNLTSLFFNSYLGWKFKNCWNDWYICTPDRHWDNALVAIRCMNPLYIYCRLISHTFWQTENTDICSCCNLIPLLFFNFPVEHISAFCLCSLPLWPLWTHLVWERSACLRPIVQNKLWIRKTSWHETEPFTINPRKCFLFIHSKLYLRSPMAHVAKLYGRLRLIRNVWEH